MPSSARIDKAPGRNAPLHQIRQIRPAHHQEHVDARCFFLGHALEFTDVQRDFGVARMEARQGARQSAACNDMLNPDNDGARRACDAGAGLFVSLGELFQRRQAGIQITAACGGQRQAMGAALKQQHTQRFLERCHQFGDGSHADLKPPGRAGKTLLAGGGNKIFQGAKLVHKSPCRTRRDD